MKKLGNLASLLCVIICLAACGPRNTRYFPRIKSTQPTEEEHRDVVLTAHLFSAQEQDDYFGVNLEAAGYRVLQISMQNNSSHRFVFRPSYCALERESGHGPALHMHYDTSTRVLWGSIPALLFWWPAIPLFVVPYGFYWHNYNNVTSHNIVQKTLGGDEALVLEPYEMTQKFMFVLEENFAPVFDFCLFNETKQELLVYSIDVSAHS